MTRTLTTSGACVLKAGTGVNSRFLSGVTTEDDWDDYINKAEAIVSSTSRRDWVTLYSGLDANTKLILDGIVSSISAMLAIQYDMSGYTSRAEAQTMLDVLRDDITRSMTLIKDDKVITFLGA